MSAWFLDSELSTCFNSFLVISWFHRWNRRMVYFKVIVIYFAATYVSSSQDVQ